MMSTFRTASSIRLRAVALMAVLTCGCAVEETKIPTLSGPSELGVSIALAAAPQILPRDGSSTARIEVRTFDSNGKPYSQRVIVTATAGTLSGSDITTNAQGLAELTYIAPSVNLPISEVTITAYPVLVGNFADTNSRRAREIAIRVIGPAVPNASFIFNPSNAAVLDVVTFDANSSSFSGALCGSACTYSWDFGDGTSGTGLVVQHTFATSGVFNVTLTVTANGVGTTDTSTRPVVIDPPAAPQANFTSGPCAVPAARCFRFNDASTVGAGATITGFLIDFGDNASTTTMPAEHTYAVAGSYNITYTVTDSLGRTNRITRPIVVP